ncbi:phage tail assembly chaperone family protein, TAC [Pseudomonas taetrolens]|uniref:phage tail assembly chaperone family protein, TAC n=1 Tax=Pseudomonas taetrolens TaxID=47884 RepID=UPI003F97771E
MNLKQLKAKGGIIDVALIKKEVIWVHADPKTGEEVTDKFTVHVRRQSFGVIERLFSPDEAEQSRNAKYIAASVLLGNDGSEAISYEDAFSLESSLGFAILTAVNEANGTGKKPVKN